MIVILYILHIISSFRNLTEIRVVVLTNDDVLVVILHNAWGMIALIHIISLCSEGDKQENTHRSLRNPY